MPIVQRDRTQDRFSEQPPRFPDEPVLSPGVLETLGAAFRLDNIIGSVISRERAGSIADTSLPLPDPDFDPFENIEGFEEHALAFAFARNRSDVEKIKTNIQRENQDRMTLARAGLAGLAASFAAGYLDVTSLIPFGGTAARGAMTGKSLLQRGLNAAQTEFVGSTVQEVVLHATQETRTLPQSAQNLAGATFLAGILGSGIPAIRKALGKSTDELGRVVEDDLSPISGPDLRDPGSIRITLDEEPGAIDGGAPSKSGGATGAAAIRDTGQAEEALKSALGLEKGTAFQSPLLRTATSPSIEARRTLQDLVETPFTYEKNALGLATPESVETRVKKWTAPLGVSIEHLDRQFVQYRRGVSGGRGHRTLIQAGDLLGRGDGQLTYREFRLQVGRAIRSSGESEIPEVSASARVFRKQLFDPLKDRAVAAKLLPEGVPADAAVSYLARVYRTERIIARRSEFRDITTQWLKRSHLAFTDEELASIADQIIDNILANPDGRVSYGAVPLARGPLKERIFDIPSLLIEDFLESDIEVVSRFYQRTMAVDVELAERFGRVDMQDQITKISDDYNDKIAGTEPASERTKLERRRREDIRDIEAMRDRLRGTYAAPADPGSVFVRAGRVARQMNFLSRLGGTMVSPLVDLARPVMIDGMTRVFGAGLVPLVRNARGVKLAAREIKLAGTAWDMALDTRAIQLADLGDDYGRHTKVEGGLTGLTNNFGIVSLMSPWNAMIKSFSGVVTMSRILEESTNLASGKIAPGELEKVGASGIDRTMAERISEQFRTHGIKDRGVWLAGTETWTDGGAVDALRSAIVREVDRTIVTLGVGDRPLWMSSELGRLVGQFRSFSMASSQRILIAGLQQRDAAMLNGAALSIALGMGIYFLKQVNAKHELSDDPRVWLAEGIDRSGATGWIFDLNNILEKGSRGTLGVNALVGGPTMSRYASRNLTGAVFGPVFGAATDVGIALGAASVDEFSEADLRAIRRLLPYQNLFYMRGLFDKAERAIGEELGVKP